MKFRLTKWLYQTRFFAIDNTPYLSSTERGESSIAADILSIL